MSTAEAVAVEAAGTQQWPYLQPVAAFRNQLKPLPDQPVVESHDRDYQVVQGYPEAVISAQGTSGGKTQPNVLQYLCRDPSPTGGFTLQPFAQGQYLCKGAAVIAQNTEGAPGSVNCFWIDETGAMRMSWMSGASSWTARSNPPDPSSVPSAAEYDPKTWNTDLGTLHVAYTPAIAGGGGRNPVVYAAQGGDSLVTVKWDAQEQEWINTVYAKLGDGLAFNDLALVPTSEQDFDLIANVSESADLGLWTGTFGDSQSLSRSSSAFSGDPGGTGDGALRQVIAASSSATGTTCAFYTDGDGNLLMWPAGSSYQRASPVPVAALNTTIGAAQLSGTGTRTNLYYAAGESLWMSAQLIWTQDGRMPFFAPPSQVVVRLASSIVALVPVAHPAELPALFAVTDRGTLMLYVPDDGDDFRSGHTLNQTAYGVGDWTGGTLVLASKQNFPIDTKSYS